MLVFGEGGGHIKRCLRQVIIENYAAPPPPPGKGWTSGGHITPNVNKNSAITPNNFEKLLLKSHFHLRIQRIINFGGISRILSPFPIIYTMSVPAPRGRRNPATATLPRVAKNC